MSKVISITILAGGLALIVFGMIAHDSASSDLTRVFTGSATEGSMWLLAGGLAATITGLVSLSRTFRVT